MTENHMNYKNKLRLHHQGRSPQCPRLSYLEASGIDDRKHMFPVVAEGLYGPGGAEGGEKRQRIRSERRGKYDFPTA